MQEKEFETYWKYFLIIDDDLKKTDRYVQHCKENLNVYSSEFARIILVACAEIDTICRLLCKEIKPTCNFTDAQTKDGKIDKYANIVLSEFPKLPTTEIYVNTIQEYISQWDGWLIKPNYHSPTWWSDYQLIKHYRHSYFLKASLGNSISSVASLLVLLLYLRKKAFGFPMHWNSDYPKCFYSNSMLDISQPSDEDLEIKKLPDF